MADIAILVAEEHERRVKILRKINCDTEGNQEIHMASCISELVQRVTEKIGAHRTELGKLVLEPKNQISVAASSSFFSA
ncbi:Ubiquitin-activating enzyme like [Quillaja saponaria]|uniref:Ubiquitin-activating enzyme like n=1 Tax=Quillaja saponaria TaxID=32244 RepID=A0AAD7P847_QUISA|nr:Ubiquitin-activating enzyme like [Quillaja saponaria]